MTNPLAHVDIYQAVDSAPTARIIGEIDSSNADSIATQLNQMADAYNTLTVDLTAVTYLDSHAMQILQTLADRHVQGSLQLTLVADMSSIAHRLLDITGINQQVPVRPPSTAHRPTAHDTSASNQNNQHTPPLS